VHAGRTFSVSFDTKTPDMSNGTPYCFVAASSRAAMLTFGDKYDASILYFEPMAPATHETAAE
jgi:hypothetical protein